jgi:hypothetical protein
MSDAARQNSQAFQLLPGYGFFLGAIQLGDIGARTHVEGQQRLPV